MPNGATKVEPQPGPRKAEQPVACNTLLRKLRVPTCKQREPSHELYQPSHKVRDPPGPGSSSLAPVCTGVGLGALRFNFCPAGFQPWWRPVTPFFWPLPPFWNRGVYPNSVLPLCLEYR